MIINFKNVKPHEVSNFDYPYINDLDEIDNLVLLEIYNEVKSVLQKRIETVTKYIVQE